MNYADRNLIVFDADCLPRGHKFECCDFSDFMYGERLIRTHDGQHFALMTLGDEVVNEVKRLLDEIYLRKLDEIETAELFNQVFGLTCDPVNGEELDASVGIVCPACRTTDVSHREFTPRRFRSFSIPIISHEKWSTMSSQQKRALIEEGLESKKPFYQLTPEKALAGKKEWVADPFNKDFMFQGPFNTLQNFASGQEVDIGKVLVSLSSLSTWYASLGIVAMFAGEPTEHLCDSFWCDYLENRIMKLSFERAKRQKRRFLAKVLGLKPLEQPRARIQFNKQGLLLANAFTLGLISEGEEIGQDSLIGTKDGRFYGVHLNKLTPFVISVFAKWKNIALLPEEFPFAIPDGYQGLLENLTAGPDEIRPAIVKACDFHLSRSKSHTDEETYEFAQPTHAIYPVEILFVFRIRQLLGLRNPDVDHPLLNTPLGKLPETKCSLSASLAPILERIKKDYQ